MKTTEPFQFKPFQIVPDLTNRIHREDNYSMVQTEHGYAFDIITPPIAKPQHDALVKLLAAAPDLAAALQAAQIHLAWALQSGWSVAKRREMAALTYQKVSDALSKLSS